MNDRIRELLRWYAGENPGVRTNLARLLNHGRLGGTGKLVILPVDQGARPRAQLCAKPGRLRPPLPFPTGHRGRL